MELTKETKKDKKLSEKKMSNELSKQFYEIFTKVISSEKATRLQGVENKITFEVKRIANKPSIKLLIENEFGKKVKSVNVQNHISGKKRAIVSFVDENATEDILGKLEIV